MERFARLSVALAFGLLVACSNNGGSSSSSNATASAEATVSAAAPAATVAAATAGEKIYNQNCSSCHQPNGQGVQGTFPPLAGNPTVTGDSGNVIAIVKFGKSGPIKVGASQYNGMMPAWGQSLSNADIAAVVTYIRSAWGNSASPVTEAAVAAAQKP
jgi:mono/diheme cytochrome c family protein